MPVSPLRSADFHAECLRRLARERDVDKDVLAFLRAHGPKRLFGAGQQAINSLYVFGTIGLAVDKLLVTKKAHERVAGVEVRAVASEQDKEGPVLIAVSEEASPAIRETLIAAGFKQVFLCADWERTNYLAKKVFFEAALTALDKELSGRWLTFGTTRLLNPLFQPDAYAALIYGTAFTDIILPAAWNETGFVSGGVYEKDGFRIEPDDVVFDIGACVGVFTAFAAARAKRVLAVEPSRSAWTWLERNGLALPNVQCVRVALADRSGWRSFYDRPDYAKYSSLVEHQGRCWVAYQTQCDTLDGLAEKSGLTPTFLKISTNGFEEEILEGAAESIRRARPRIVVAGADAQRIAAVVSAVEPAYCARVERNVVYLDLETEMGGP